MINYDSIISVFNEKGTLLKWLKKVEKALKESVLTNVEVLQGESNSFAFKFTFQDNTSVTTDYVTIQPDINATLLHNFINGSDTVVVDLNELQNKLIVKLDEEYKKTLATKSEVATKQNTITDSEEIVKHTGENDKLYLNNNITNKINNSIQLPATAPTSTKLVGIDTNKAQTNIGIGEGLSLENGTLKATGGGGGGVEVVANPITNATEVLSKLQVDLTTYSIPKSGDGFTLTYDSPSATGEIFVLSGKYTDQSGDVNYNFGLKHAKFAGTHTFENSVLFYCHGMSTFSFITNNCIDATGKKPTVIEDYKVYFLTGDTSINYED